MIIDTHAHIGHMIGFNMKESELLYSMERYGVDFSLVSNIEAAEFDHKGRKIPAILQKKQNKILRKTLEIVRRNQKKLGALIWLKLFSELPDGETERLIRDNRELIYGIKLHPFHSRVAPDSERAEAVYRLAAEYGLPIVSHTGGCEEARSVHLYNAAKKHPELDFVMVHMDLGTDNSEALELLGKLKNLYGDTTWVPIKTTVEAIKRYGGEKMLFGTDNPIDGKDTLLRNKTGDRSLYQAYFNELRALICEDDYKLLMHKNAERIFKLKAVTER